MDSGESISVSIDNNNQIAEYDNNIFRTSECKDAKCLYKAKVIFALTIWTHSNACIPYHVSADHLNRRHYETPSFYI